MGDLILARYVGKRPLSARLTEGGERVLIASGWEGRVSASLLHNYAHRFKVLEAAPSVPAAVRVMVPDVTKYHKGGGWYNIRGQNMRRAEAEAALQELAAEQAKRSATQDLGPISREDPPDLRGDNRGPTRRK